MYRSRYNNEKPGPSQQPKKDPSLLSLPIPHPRNLRMPHLLLQLKDAIHERLARGRTPRNIDIHGNDPIAPPRNRIAIMIVPATVGTTAHADDPARVGHLVVNLPQRRRHLVGQRAGDDHHVGLARRGAEDDAQPVLVVARRAEVHHLDGAAGQAEGHGPEGGLAGPVGDLVEGGSVGKGGG